MDIPQTMKAWTYTSRGSARDILQLIDLPTPVPGPNELLVRVSHVGLNAGMLAMFAFYPHWTSAPCIPEMDFSGVIVASPDSTATDGVKVGDQVFGCRSTSELLSAKGALCEYIIAQRDLVVRKPATLSLAQASGLAACGCTAVQACRLAGIKSGDKVLITGGSGGLGSILVQYARGLVGETGRIVATCSGKNVELVRSLGADEVIDYTKHVDLSAYCAEHYREKEFDAILDVVGDFQLHANCPAYLKKDGMFVLLGDMKTLANIAFFPFLWRVIRFKLERYRPVWLGGVPRQHRMMNAVPNEADLKAFTRVIEGQRPKMQVDAVWRMEDAKEAYERLATQRARGKIVIQVDPEASA